MGSSHEKLRTVRGQRRSPLLRKFRVWGLWVRGRGFSRDIKHRTQGALGPEELIVSTMIFADAKQRFSNRVADYIRYRPGYPAVALEVLREDCGLRPGHVIADIGSGTGFLSELFLKNGNRVYGVEPNTEMRQAGEEYLASYDGFSSIEGSAESTTLEDSSVDFVTAGQAFHWFEPEK